MVDTAKQQPVSLRDELAASYDEQAGRNEGTQTPEPEEEIEDTEGAEAGEDEPGAGGEQGKQQANEEQEEEEEQEQLEEVATTQKNNIPPPLEVPKHWKAEDKAKLAKLPDDVKQILLRRHKEMEKDYVRKTQDLAAKSREVAAEVAAHKQFKETVDHVIAPYRQHFAMHGMDEVGGIRYLLGWFQSLQQNPEQTIVSLAQQYGVDFTPKPGQQVNPELAPVIGEIQALKSQFAQQSQAQQSAFVSSIQQQVNSFRDAKDENGDPMYPHFETVRGDMSMLIQSGRAASMEEAYGMAVRLYPFYDEQLKESIIGQQQSSQQQELHDAARKAAQAKKAAKGVRSASANVEKTQPRTLREDLSAAYDELAARN